MQLLDPALGEELEAVFKVARIRNTLVVIPQIEILLELYLIILSLSTNGVLKTMLEYSIDQVANTLYKTLEVLIYYLRLLLTSEFIKRVLFLYYFNRKTYYKNRDISFEIKAYIKHDLEVIIEDLISDKELSYEAKLSSIITIKSTILSKILFNNKRIDYIISHLFEIEGPSSHSKYPQLKYNKGELINIINNHSAINRDLTEVYSKLKQFENEYELKICHRNLSELVYTF